MKLVLTEEKPETKVRLYLIQSPDGNVYLRAEDNKGIAKSLLAFKPDGTAYRLEDANTGDFKFDALGRIIVG